MEIIVRYPTNAMVSAVGRSSRSVSSDIGGMPMEGKPAGTSPTTRTPRASRFANALTAMERQTTASA